MEQPILAYIRYFWTRILRRFLQSPNFWWLRNSAVNGNYKGFRIGSQIQYFGVSTKFRGDLTISFELNLSEYPTSCDRNQISSLDHDPHAVQIQYFGVSAEFRHTELAIFTVTKFLVTVSEPRKIRKKFLTGFWINAIWRLLLVGRFRSWWEAVGCRVQRLLFLPSNLICTISDTD